MGSVRRRRLVVAFLVGVLAIAVLPACGGSDASDKPPRVKEIKEQLLPPQILGLSVGTEDVGKVLQGARRPFIDSVVLYSLRREELLQATLQVSRFTADSGYAEGSFQRTVARQIVSTGDELPTFRMGDRTVYLGGNARQSIAVWFRGRLMMVLATRVEFEAPRALLRELVSLDFGKEFQ